MLLKAIFILPELCIYIWSSTISPNRFFVSLRMMAWHIIAHIQTDSSLRCAWWRGASSVTYKQILRCAAHKGVEQHLWHTNRFFAALRMKAWSNISDIQTDSSLRSEWQCFVRGGRHWWRLRRHQCLRSKMWCCHSERSEESLWVQRSYLSNSALLRNENRTSVHTRSNRFFSALRMMAWRIISNIQTDSSLRCAWRRGATSPTYKQILRCAQNDNAPFAGVGTDCGFAAISASIVRCDVVILSEAKNLYEFRGATSRIARSYVMKKDILTAINLCSCPEEKFIQL